MQTFSRLRTCNNTEIAEPEESDLRQALTELFHGINEELDDTIDELPSVWYAVGVMDDDAAPFHTIIIDRGGIATFQFWSVCTNQPDFEHRAHVTEADAHLLWEHLRKRKTDTILAWFLSRFE